MLKPTPTSLMLLGIAAIEESRNGVTTSLLKDAYVRALGRLLMLMVDNHPNLKGCSKKRRSVLDKKTNLWGECFLTE